MWIFGYGSLMWDGWEQNHCCLQRVVGELPGYRRAFNKASIKNWGSKASPGPTLNIEQAEQAVCCGIAFEFPDEKADSVLAYLRQREGNGFNLKQMSITLRDGKFAKAFIAFYEGPNKIKVDSTTELANLIALASGSSGSCREYVRGIYVELSKLGLTDSVVTTTWQAVQQLA
ncbi:cation transport protein ChaC [Collimonas sp. OK242]|nr:cation transport protein ChaC [Collimonas sp. OK242]